MDNYAGNLTPPNMFQMPGMTGAANTAMTGISGLNDFAMLGSSVLPQAQQTAQNLYNNPFAQQGLQGAQAGAQLGGQAAMTGFNTGAGLTDAGLSLVPYAGQIMQQGFDPQQQLYQRTLQQVQDQSNVNNAMAGVATTPYGAGLTNQATTNFNIDWQNQQLAREAQAAQAAGGLVNQGAGVAGQGVGLMNQAPGQLVQSAMLPYATYSDIGQGQNQALSQLLGIGGQGESLGQLPIQDLLAYLGVGNQAGSVANQNFANQLKQSQLGWDQMSGLAGGIGSYLGGAGGQNLLNAIPGGSFIAPFLMA